jgi:hypothetical protein
MPLFVIALIAAALAAPAGSAADATTTFPLDHVTMSVTLRGKLSGKLAIRLTRGTKVYARGSKAIARPGKNTITLNATRNDFFPGRYTMRWSFTPRNGTKASQGAKIVTVNAPSSTG